MVLVEECQISSCHRRALPGTKARVFNQNLTLKVTLIQTLNCRIWTTVLTDCQLLEKLLQIANDAVRGIESLTAFLHWERGYAAYKATMVLRLRQCKHTCRRCSTAGAV